MQDVELNAAALNAQIHYGHFYLVNTFNADKHSLIGTAANAFNVGVSCVTTHVDSPPCGKFLAQAEKSINETDRTYADTKKIKKENKKFAVRFSCDLFELSKLFCSDTSYREYSVNE